MAKRAKVQVPKPTVGYGYSGVWNDGTIGWFQPRFISRYDKRRNPADCSIHTATGLGDERVFLCKITLTPVKDKLGRPITKIVKGTK